MEPHSTLSCKVNTDRESRSDDTDVIAVNSNIPDYLRSSTEKDAHNCTSQIITQRIHNEFRDDFTEIGCFDDTFRLQVKEDSWPYQTPSKRLAYALQESLREEIEFL